MRARKQIQTHLIPKLQNQHHQQKHRKARKIELSNCLFSEKKTLRRFATSGDVYRQETQHKPRMHSSPFSVGPQTPTPRPTKHAHTSPFFPVELPPTPTFPKTLSGKISQVYAQRTVQVLDELFEEYGVEAVDAWKSGKHMQGMLHDLVCRSGQRPDFLPLIERSVKRHGLNPNMKRQADHNTPLHLAEWYGLGEAAQMLRSLGSTDNMSNKYGESPADLARIAVSKRVSDLVSEDVEETVITTENAPTPYAAPWSNVEPSESAPTSYTTPWSNAGAEPTWGSAVLTQRTRSLPHTLSSPVW